MRRFLLPLALLLGLFFLNHAPAFAQQPAGGAVVETPPVVIPNPNAPAETPGNEKTPAPITVPEGRTFVDADIAVLQGLDKPNARVLRFEVPVGQTGQFGPLQVRVRTCKKTAPEDAPESAAFMEIVDTRVPTGQPNLMFSGWMFASSPALSALQNATYDIWVLDCKKTASKAATPAASPKDAAPKKASPSSARPKSR